MTDIFTSTDELIGKLSNAYEGSLQYVCLINNLRGRLAVFKALLPELDDLTESISGHANNKLCQLCINIESQIKKIEEDLK